MIKKVPGSHIPGSAPSGFGVHHQAVCCVACECSEDGRYGADAAHL